MSAYLHVFSYKILSVLLSIEMFQVKLLRENEEVLQAAVAIAKMLKINDTSKKTFFESDSKENANVHLAKKVWKVMWWGGRV